MNPHRSPGLTVALLPTATGGVNPGRSEPMIVDRCCACGFLALREENGAELLEVFETHRQSLNVIHPAGTPLMFSQFPLCSVLATSIQTEASNRLEDVPAVLARLRSCKSSYAWVPGFTPKEHKKMWHEEEMWKLQQGQKQEERDWQAEQRKADRDWQAEQRDADRQLQISMKRWDRGWQLVALVVGTLIGHAFIPLNEWLKTRREPTTQAAPSASGSQDK